jgi:DNA-binding LacI/PurR family transcriptional regulator
VRQDFEELGRRAIGVLLDEIEGAAVPAPPRVRPRLVVRASTAQVTIQDATADVP